MAATNVETEIKLPWNRTALEAREMIELQGYHVVEARTLEADQLFDRALSELRQSDKLLRLRRSGSRYTVTYKGPAIRDRYKSREEIEFEVSAADAFEQVLDRLGYVPLFRYEKYRTKFAAPNEPGVITLDETPIGTFLEIEGPAGWIDDTATRLGFSPAEYCTVSYAALYRDYRRTHQSAPVNMTFQTADWPSTTEKAP